MYVKVLTTTHNTIQHNTTQYNTHIMNYTDYANDGNHIGNVMILLYFFSFFGFYVGVDALIGKKYEGKYFLIHGLNNAFIVYLTYDDLISTFTNFNSVLTNNVNILPSIITYSLHVYHTFVYHHKFTFDDWLHHILMGAALIIAHQFHTGRLINYSLFFTTGLPGMFDYLLLFFVKNNKIEPVFEKKNKQLDQFMDSMSGVHVSRRFNNSRVQYL